MNACRSRIAKTSASRLQSWDHLLTQPRPAVFHAVPEQTSLGNFFAINHARRKKNIRRLRRVRHGDIDLSPRFVSPLAPKTHPHGRNIFADGEFIILVGLPDARSQPRFHPQALPLSLLAASRDFSGGSLASPPARQPAMPSFFSSSCGACVQMLGTPQILQWRAIPRVDLESAEFQFVQINHLSRRGNTCIPAASAPRPLRIPRSEEIRCPTGRSLPSKSRSRRRNPLFAAQIAPRCALCSAGALRWRPSCGSQCADRDADRDPAGSPRPSD